MAIEAMEDIAVPSPPAAETLRETFGDRKPPDISRKITACVACRKQKIKCHMGNSQPPCARCKSRGLPCVVNRSLQMLLEDDATWKHSITRKVRILEAAMNMVQDKLSIPGHTSNDSSESSGDASLPGSRRHDEPNLVASPALPESHGPPSRPWEVLMDPDSGPATIPASCVSEVRESEYPHPGGSTTPHRPDLVSRGIVSLEEAQRLFTLYSQRLDHFLYRILGDATSLSEIRSSSPLLTAAIFTVSALHSAELSHLYDRCYQEFVSLSAAQTFAKENSLDDVRGLCIGAFWLSEVSWILVGTAVRIATQVQLHRSIHTALTGDKESYVQTRLYYLVYVCDHHFSVAYGRPPMTRECESISAASRLLETENATEDDSRLISQVEIWSTASRVFDTFGVDVDTPVSPELVPQLRRFMIALDTWRADWNERFVPNRNVGNYPRKGVGLHFHFAKLYLCSHAFRGAPTTSTPPHVAQAHELSPDMDEIANAAVLSAKTIVRTIAADPELQSYLNGLPLYFDTMIAFAVVFLLKVASKYSGTIRADGAEILVLVGQISRVLRVVTARMHRQHLLVYIANDVERLLQKCQQPSQLQQTLLEPIMSQTSASLDHTDLLNRNGDWIENMCNYDFLSSSLNNTSGLEAWPFSYDLG